MNRTTLRNGKGVTIVEFALVFPLLMVLIFGVMDFGMYFFVQHSIQYATREGVRLALVGRTINDASGNAMSREASIVQTIREQGLGGRQARRRVGQHLPRGRHLRRSRRAGRPRRTRGSPGSYMRVQDPLHLPVRHAVRAGRLHRAEPDPGDRGAGHLPERALQLGAPRASAPRRQDVT